jgi:GT2 family glycosyltransferase
MGKRPAAALKRDRAGAQGQSIGARIPLSALRERLDAGSAGAHWSVDADHVPGRGLVQLAGREVSFPLRLGGPVSLHGRVRLLPHDWRDGSAAARASIAVTQADGTRHEIWTGLLASAAAQGHPDGLALHCELPPSTTALLLNVQQHDPRDGRSVGRVIWIEPEIIDPSAVPDPVPQPDDRLDQRPTAPAPTSEPLISVLTPVHDPPLEMLEEAIASVLHQTFSNWELCLVDDGSRKPEIIAALQRHAAGDPRIHLLRRDSAGGISTATNAALELATGQYIALLDHDDTLEPTALELVANKLNDDPTLDMIYTDEAVVSEAGTVARIHKPDWSPENMTALMYTCHLGVYRRRLACEIGGFRPAFDGCQDYDFVLRLVEHSDRIAHIPQILYHWRAHASSTAGGDGAKPYAYLAQPRAIAAHLERVGAGDAQVLFGAAAGVHRIVYPAHDAVTVSLVLAVSDERGLSDAARSWLAQPHRNWQVVLAGPPDVLPACAAALQAAGVEQSRTTMLPIAPGTDRAQALASAAAAARTDHLLLMQVPIVGLTHDWLRRLLGYSIQQGIAAAGPMLLAPDGRILTAGVSIPEGIPLHLLHGLEVTAGSDIVMNLSAVSDVLLTTRGTYDQLDGLRPQLRELALIDFCLRATEVGQRIVSVPDARVRATSTEYVVNDIPTLWQLRRNWWRSHTYDPYYSRYYRHDRGDYRLSEASRYPAEPAHNAEAPIPAINLGARSASTLNPRLLVGIVAEDSPGEIAVR